MTSDSGAPPDKRTHPWRGDLAASELRGRVEAPRYVDGETASVAAAVTAVRREPRPSASLDTEALFGERVRVLDTADGWSWVQLARDGYVGYVRTDDLSSGWREPTHRIQALATFVYPVPDIKAPPILCLPMGASVAVEHQEPRFSKLATGGYVITRHAIEMTRHSRDFVDVAERFIGSPYLWGGRTRLGLDCSGLLQTALDAAGIACPRDSDMQEQALGEAVLVPDNLEGLARGDLVFWPGHVGIMVDGVMLLHANAHHMAVAVEPLQGAADRVRRDGGAIRTIRRLPALSAVA